MYIFVALIVAACVGLFLYLGYRWLTNPNTEKIINNVVDKDLEDRVDDVIRERVDIKSEVSAEEKRVRNLRNKTKKL